MSVYKPHQRQQKIIRDARVTIGGFTFVQAHRQYLPGSSMTVPIFTSQGDPIYALPGGGRATLPELRKKLGTADPEPA